MQAGDATAVGQDPGIRISRPSTPYGNSTAGNLQTTLGEIGLESAQCVL